MADISSINGSSSFSAASYVNHLTEQSAAKTTETLERTINGAGKGSGPTEEELMDACKQFEAYFLEQVFKSMQKPIDALKEANGFRSNSLVDYFQDTTIQAIATSSTEREGTGLAQQLFENMKRNYNIGNAVSAEDAIASQEKRDADVANGIDPDADKDLQTVKYI